MKAILMTILMTILAGTLLWTGLTLAQLQLWGPLALVTILATILIGLLAYLGRGAGQ